MYKIFRTKAFIHQFNKIIPKNLSEDIERRVLKMAENPFIGKPLGNHIWEIKANNFRIYYSLFDEELIILFIGVSNKKHQQEQIDALKKIDFKEFIEKYKKSGDTL